jgi:magnesium transporter
MNMELRQSLAGAFAARYPMEVASALESRPTDEIARALQGLPRDTAASVIKSISPGISARALERLDPDTAAGIVADLGTEEGIPLLRRVSTKVRDAIIERVPAKQANALKAVLRYPAGTAGALMDPRVAALPADMETDEALKAVRREAEHAHDVLYVVDREHRLAGVLSLQQLLSSRPKDRLETIMQAASHQLSPSTDRHTVARHRGWRDARSLPVVDGDGRLLGAIHYRTVTALEDELYPAGTSGDATAKALGDLLWTGIGGVIDAITAAVGPPRSSRAPNTAAADGARPPTGAIEGGERHTEGEE